MEHTAHHDTARTTFHAYGRATAHKTHDGKKIPKWDDLGEKIQRAWVKAADAAGAAALIALADRIDGGAQSGPVTLMMREEAARLVAFDPNDPEPEVEGAAVPEPQTAADAAALAEATRQPKTPA